MSKCQPTYFYETTFSLGIVVGCKFMEIYVTT
jgi:hypothetical protein